MKKSNNPIKQALEAINQSPQKKKATQKANLIKLAKTQAKKKK